MTEVDAYIIGTEPWYLNYSGSTSLSDIKSTTQDVWDTNISDGTGAYQLDLTTLNDVVPKSEITTSGDIWDRADEVDDWCQNNIYYGNADVIITADYWGGDPDHSGGAQSNAGTYENRVCLVDYESGLSSEWQSEGHELLHSHELLHMFIDPDDSDDSEHYPTSYYDGDTTLMYSPGNVESWCYYSYSPSEVVDDVSSCTVDTVRNWIDNNMY